MSPKDNRRNIPVVFISSTVEDLKPYRAAADFEADRAGFKVLMQEYWVASGDKPPLKKCLEEVAKADVLVVIAAHRYGWVPPDQTGGDAKSITWLECEEALREGEGKKKIEVLAFLVGEDSGDFKWPLELREEYRLAEAAAQGKFTPELGVEVPRNLAKLPEFKQWLSALGTRARFTSPDSLRAEVAAALRNWLKHHPEFADSLEPHGRDDPTLYLQDMRQQTSFIELRGLKVGSGEAIRIPIEKLYIPLTTTLAEEATSRKAGERGMATNPEPRATPRIRLEEALKHRLLVIVGDPGSGKTTFLRHLALVMCKRLLGEDETAGEKSLGGPVGEVFPMRIAIATLWRHIEEAHKRGSGPTTLESSGWLAHYLATQCGEAELDLKEEFFRARLSSDSAMVLLDGLDEAPSDQDRRRLVKLIEDAARVYAKCRFVVTSRPAAYVGDALLPGFVQARINDLEDEAIDLFLKRWCEELFLGSPKDAKDHHAELLDALRTRPEIRRLARNAVMLTALAVVHWDKKRLPEQRADLYESILEKLAASRPRPGRQSPERCIGLLQNLALAMQDHPKGRQVQAPRYWAAREIAPAWREAPDEDRAALAEQFLKDEELDSGIVVARGDDTRFWHLTFQEYLAGRALAARDDRRREFLSQAQLYQPEWREVILLLAGVLYHQGPERVDGMVAAILDRLGSRLDSKQALGEQARAVGLLGAVVRDLAPVRYQPGDARYKQALDAVLGIFDAKKAHSIDFNVRLEAAEALGQAGDPRLGRTTGL